MDRDAPAPTPSTPAPRAAELAKVVAVGPVPQSTPDDGSTGERPGAFGPVRPATFGAVFRAMICVRVV